LDTTSHVFQKAYFNQTFVDPFCLILLLLMTVAMLGVSRKYAVWPMIVIACFVTQAQRLSPGGVDFVFLRLITIVAVIRILVRGEFAGFKWNGMDTAILFFMGIRVLWGFLHITKSATVTPLTLVGEAIDTWGIYFFIRCVVRDFNDLKSMTYGFICASLLVAPLFIVEYTTLHNPFSFMGGVSDVTRSRDEKLRCMGAYSHPILAGCFWAVVLPYMGAIIKQGGRIRFLPLVGIACASVVIVLSGSSSPIAGAGIAFCGGCAFLLRRRMRMLRWVTFLTILAVQVMATNPIWHIFARVQIIGGSTGYYRFKLIDQFISHFHEWWLAGSSRGTSTWAVPMFDIVNYYVTLGLSGGLLFVLLLVWVFVSAYRNVGRAMRTAAGHVEWELMAWATGVAVFTHMVTFLAVTYYGQIIFVWYVSLAVTSVRNANPQRRGFSIVTGRYNVDALSRLASRPVLPYRQPSPYAHR
jgi:hypothetical protein